MYYLLSSWGVWVFFLSSTLLFKKFMVQILTKYLGSEPFSTQLGAKKVARLCCWKWEGLQITISIFFFEMLGRDTVSNLTECIWLLTLDGREMREIGGKQNDWLLDGPIVLIKSVHNLCCFWLYSSAIFRLAWKV